MSRMFAYCRVSTSEQTTENQIQAIGQRGYTIEPQRVITETISGGVSAMERPKFAAMVEHKLEAGDQLIVLKLDRLGRDNIDVQNTIAMLTERGIKVVSLDLPAVDLTSSEGKLMLQIISAFAEFEKSRIRERTAEGVKRAAREGKFPGRPKPQAMIQKIQDAKAEGLSQSKTVEKTGASLSTVKRYWNLGR